MTLLAKGTYGPQTGKRSKKHVKCFNCDIIGHYSHDCPRNQKMSRETIPELKKLERVPTTKPGKTVPIIQDIIQKPNEFSYHRIRLIGGDVQGDVTALVDTGSTLNIEHPELARHFVRSGAKKVDELLLFTTAAGQSKAEYHTWVTVVVQGTTFKPVYINTKFTVANVGDNIIMGNVWLKDNGLRDLAVPATSRKSIEVDNESLQYLADDMKYFVKRISQEELNIQIKKSLIASTPSWLNMSHYFMVEVNINWRG